MKTGFFGQRRDYFIKKWLQFKFTLIFLVTIIIGNIIFGSYVYAKLDAYLQEYLYVSHTRGITNTWDIIGKIIIEPSLWAIVIFFCIFLVIIFFITRKMSKGFDVISQDLKALASGDLTTERDIPQSGSLKTLSRDYLEFRSSLKGHIVSTKENAAEFDAALNNLIAKSDAKDGAGVVSALEELERSYERLHGSINNIQV